MDYNDRLYTMWMDCGRQQGRYMLMPCGHNISLESLRETGGICPVCEMDKDQEELGEWPPAPEEK
jgi:hypothetical protein